MKIVFRQLGRTLIILIILISAFNKLQKPENHTKAFAKQYQSIQTFTSNQLSLNYLPPLQQVQHRITLFVKGFGLFQCLIAVLIFFGDWFGGFMYFVYLIGANVCAYKWSDFPALKVCGWGSQKHLQFANFVGLLGIALVLTSCGCKKQIKKV